MTVFLSEAWLQVMLESGAVSGIVPLLEGVHVGAIRSYGQTRWALFGSWEEKQAEGLQEIFQQARRAGVYAVGSHFNMARWPAEVVTPLGAEVIDPFGTYCVNLTQSEETLWRGLHAKHRNVIRRAQESGLEIRSLDWEAFIPVMATTYRKGGRENPFGEKYLHALRRHMGETLFAVGVYAQGQLQAGAIIPFDRQRGYYLHGATIADPVLGAANLLHWEIMRMLRNQGVATYDLGGARRESDDVRLQGIFRFKERFGGIFEPCCHWQRVVSGGRYLLFKVVRKIWGGSK
ncbi:MAG: GNAT family N-acetyltransferase [Magnetococcales bacterium]|nr:GNAT family N-acetyltransferase [Magnetococcales bacterium]